MPRDGACVCVCVRVCACACVERCSGTSCFCEFLACTTIVPLPIATSLLPTLSSLLTALRGPRGVFSLVVLLYQVTIMRTFDANFHHFALLAETSHLLDDMFDALTYLSSTTWRVNQKVSTHKWKHCMCVWCVLCVVCVVCVCCVCWPLSLSLSVPVSLRLSVHEASAHVPSRHVPLTLPFPSPSNTHCPQVFDVAKAVFQAEAAVEPLAVPPHEVPVPLQQPSET